MKPGIPVLVALTALAVLLGRIPSAEAAESNALRFARALDERRQALDWGSRKKAELDLGNALLAAGATLPAHRACSALLADAEAGTSIQVGALECLNRIERRYPHLATPANQQTDPSRVATLDPRNPEVREWTFRQLEQAMARGAHVPAWMERLPAGSYEARLAEAWTLSSQKRPDSGYRKMVEILSEKSVPDALERHLNANRILAARMAFALDKHAEAAAWLKSVDKHSNLSPTALEELTWAMLEGNSSGGAVGTALQLQKGLLSRAFAPEAPMVLAMALNESCHYPAALKTVQRFRKKWESPNQWIEAETAHPKPLLPRLRQLIAQAGRQAASPAMPATLGWELIRSPAYLSAEGLAAELRQMGPRLDALREQARTDQLKLAREILALNERISREIRDFRAKGNDGDLSPSIIRSIEGLRESWKSYRALRKSTGPLKKMAAFARQSAVAITAGVEKKLESDLRRRLNRMAGRLEDVVDNLALMEIEILDGASRDLVWRNSHPEAAENIRKRLAELQGEAPTWNWGSALTQLESDDWGENEEVWEDELGAHVVALSNRCIQKEKQL